LAKNDAHQKILGFIKQKLSGILLGCNEEQMKTQVENENAA